MASSANSRLVWCTVERVGRISPENKEKYERYFKACRKVNKFKTTYTVYYGILKQFMCFLAIYHDNIDVYSDDFMLNGADIMTDFLDFCQDTLHNHTSAINTKVAAVKSFFNWSVEKGYIQKSPFEMREIKLHYPKEAGPISPSYYLTEEQVAKIRYNLEVDENFDMQDQLLFELAYDSANCIGVLESLSLEKLDMENSMFVGIKEKRGKVIDVVFSEKTAELLKKWMSLRKNGFDYLTIDSPFITYYGKKYVPMARGAIHRRIRKYGKTIGIDNLRSESLRKSRLSNIFAVTGDMLTEQQRKKMEKEQLAVAPGGDTQGFVDAIEQKMDIRDRVAKLRKEREKAGEMNGDKA